ncbi:protein TIC 40, chloroplastic [Pistacia vera]|uniref:protein TIC 40, chloroplastic n=1 Tax=Pistacia vera TaxID=55513 RepID=UPI001263C267|nr:protein TIC 40, chloroplastic [Pistacia vera]
MENVNMALVSSTSPKLVFSNTGFRNPTREISRLRRNSSFAMPFTLQSSRIGARTSRISVCARAGSRRIGQNGKVGADVFANLSSSSGQHTSSVGVNPNLAVPPPSSSIGSPLFWVGVGVGLSALFSFAASRLKQYAMQQAMKTMMNQMNTQNNQFSNAAFSPGSPFPFPTPSPSGPGAPFSPTSQPSVTDVSATKVEAASATDVKNETEFKSETKVKDEPKKYAFVDVSPDDTLQKSPFENFEDSETSSSKDSQFQEVTQNGAAFNQGFGDSQGAQSTGKKKGALSVETLEKMMEDPTVQKMVYPYLPEEMRNPTTFKWMLQNPQYRQQLEEMLTNMAGSEEWDKRMMDTLKNFDLNSPDIKQQFDQIGLTPEEVISKIMANPDVAMAFQNPRVQAAIMDCSQNPLSISKYQNDKEVMDVFNKISELFPGVTGPP